MNNEQRRASLDRARDEAFEWARAAEDHARDKSYGAVETKESLAMASMWALVAQALKTGDAHADTPEH